ncbi:hypothetical protein QFZ75_007642 [Streptomyces sp. V3I8]|uniref:DUF2795 domain-containing protein n=1 Tax=Streptomyces sp. V3I8 TaxID=3042279 RepID=UPI002783D5B5|nr:DUF2795 domain-containing protein [Streptomyces sp. V3I8]MDQ1041226.1 hypothetical protein [Streptomyces sp. V3I8]
MERGSNPVGPRKDDEMKHELEGYLRSGQHTHVEEGNDPEPAADDDIRVDPGGPVPPPGAERDRARADSERESLRLEMARHLEGAVFPADRQTVLDVLEAHHAPDTVLEAARRLPDSGTYANVTEIVTAAGDSRQAE